MEPIPHLSLPVRDLDEARAFYVETLGCAPGRVRDGWIDVWFYGMQITLQEQPEQLVPIEHAGVRHFGVTLGAKDLAALLRRLDAHPIHWLHTPATEYADTPEAQTKAKLVDPSGNVIELKAYADPERALERRRPRPQRS